MKQTKQGLILQGPKDGLFIPENRRVLIRQVDQFIEVYELKCRLPIIEVIKDAQKEVDRRELTDDQS